MSEVKKNPNNIGIVGIQSTRVEKDLSGRDKNAFTLGTPTGGPGAGIYQVDTLFNIIKPLVGTGQSIVLDFRTEEKLAKGNRKFKSSFLLVNKVPAEDETHAGASVGSQFESAGSDTNVALQQNNKINESL